MGIFGLTSFTAEQRFNEIGMRKVLGASTSQIVFVLTNHFPKWVFVSNLNAIPVASFIMQ